MSEKRLRVLVVDDHDVVHWGFRLLLTDQTWVERCLSARTGEEAVGRGALLEFGPEGGDWRVRLVVPVEDG